jgi:hypothetical protein
MRPVGFHGHRHVAGIRSCCVATVRERDLMSDQLVIFAHFRAVEGKEIALEAELRSTAAIARAEHGCLFIAIYRWVT